jgi:hypothetical protein
LQGEGGEGGEAGGQPEATGVDSAVGRSKDGEDDPDLAPPAIHAGQLNVFDVLGDG